MKTGFFGGTFDPIHNGHLNLALGLMEAHDLDKVLFTPAGTSPTKETAPPIASKEARKKMVELAIQGIPEFEVCPLELEREGPSYTIDTIRQLMAKEPEMQLFLLLGEDVFEGIESWKEHELLLSLAPPLLGRRIESKGREGTPIPLMEISSTAIRERLKKNLYCGHLMPAKVLDFIEENKVY